VINSHKCHMINRRFRRNGIDLIRNRGGNLPGPCC
jgi:hypothetical protein